MSKELTLNVTLDEANVLFQALGTQPYGQVYQLIAKLQGQAQGQLKPEQVSAGGTE